VGEGGGARGRLAAHLEHDLVREDLALADDLEHGHVDVLLVKSEGFADRLVLSRAWDAEVVDSVASLVHQLADAAVVVLVRLVDIHELVDRAHDCVGEKGGGGVQRGLAGRESGKRTNGSKVTHRSGTA
jgi:hypothetical protein